MDTTSRFFWGYGELAKSSGKIKVHRNSIHKENITKLVQESESISNSEWVLRYLEMPDKCGCGPRAQTSEWFDACTDWGWSVSPAPPWAAGTGIIGAWRRAQWSGVGRQFPSFPPSLRAEPCWRRQLGFLDRLGFGFGQVPGSNSSSTTALQARAVGKLPIEDEPAWTPCTYEGWISTLNTPFSVRDSNLGSIFQS
jgi:hypothetical protein